MTIYATSGERVTCENGHHICTFLETVAAGQREVADCLTDWQQAEPMIGEYIPNCHQCGAPFYLAGGMFHFGEGVTAAWRIFSADRVVNTLARPLPLHWDA